MNIEEIKNLAAIMKEYDLNKLEITAEGAVLERSTSTCENSLYAAPYSDTQAERCSTEIGGEAADESNSRRRYEKENRKNTENTITSPLVGIFYCAPSPKEDPFVKAGDTVHEGDVICIIEAMKMMNEVTSDKDGVIAEVYAEEGTLVEFGQPLFRLEAK